MSAIFNPQPKDAEFRNRALLDLANGQQCKNCGGSIGVVSAHSNSMLHGKGKSHKAHDCFVAWLCQRCHEWLDQGLSADPTVRFNGSRADKAEMWQRAANETLLEMWRQGLIVVAGKSQREARYRRPSKTCPRRLT